MKREERMLDDEILRQTDQEERHSFYTGRGENLAVVFVQLN